MDKVSLRRERARKMPVKEESKQGDVEDKLIRMESVSYCNSINFKKIDEMAVKD